MKIYGTFLQGHLKQFSESVQEMSTKILQAALALHDKVATTFRKTAINFHYEFTVRHLANVFQVCGGVGGCGGAPRAVCCVRASCVRVRVRGWGPPWSGGHHVAATCLGQCSSSSRSSRVCPAPRTPAPVHHAHPRAPPHTRAGPAHVHARQLQLPRQVGQAVAARERARVLGPARVHGGPGDVLQGHRGHCQEVGGARACAHPRAPDGCAADEPFAFPTPLFMLPFLPPSPYKTPTLARAGTSTSPSWTTTTARRTPSRSFSATLRAAWRTRCTTRCPTTRACTRR